MDEIGVKKRMSDDFRIFPTSHSSATIIEGLQTEMQRVGISVTCNQRVSRVLVTGKHIDGVKTQTNTFLAPNIIIANGYNGFHER